MAASLRSKLTVSSTLRTHSAWWLLAMHSDSQREVLTLTHGGSEVLPVFSFREEAEMYLLMERLGSDWQIRETDVGELAWVFSEQCARVRSVALDPALRPYNRSKRRAPRCPDLRGPTRRR
jgi:hypothetical protein